MLTIHNCVQWNSFEGTKFSFKYAIRLVARIGISLPRSLSLRFTSCVFLRHPSLCALRILRPLSKLQIYRSVLWVRRCSCAHSKICTAATLPFAIVLMLILYIILELESCSGDLEPRDLEASVLCPCAHQLTIDASIEKIYFDSETSSIYPQHTTERRSHIRNWKPAKKKKNTNQNAI